MEYNKGKLVRWFGNKGFGFIKPDQGNVDIFIHISAIKEMNRKPIVGDIIHYEISSDANGKNRAVNAKIESVEQISRSEPIKNSLKTAHSNPNKKPTKAKKLKSVLILIVAVLGFALNSFQNSNVDFIPSVEKTAQKTDDSGSQRLSRAYKNKQSDIQVAGTGIVVRTLADDTTGSQHQRFILRLASGQTLLIAHNIDLAPRINSLRKGDKVDFYGEYEWNSNGGVLHWTHKDPRGNHQNGWLKHKGLTYQ